MCKYVCVRVCVCACWLVGWLGVGEVSCFLSTVRGGVCNAEKAAEKTFQRRQTVQTRAYSTAGITNGLI